MAVSDELLKLKQLLDSGAITKDEFDSMKAKLLNDNNESYEPQHTSSVETYNSSEPTRTSTYYKSRYFNATPFKVIGWISVCFAALFSIICIILLCEYEYGAAMAMVWELTFFPGTLAIIMGAIVKTKEYSSALLIAGIIFAIASVVVSIVTTVEYYNDLAGYLYPYLY